MKRRSAWAARRVWDSAARHVGRRGAILISYAWLSAIYALSLLHPAPPTGRPSTAAYLAQIAPPGVWAAVWGVCSGLCLAQSVMRADRAAYGFASCLMLTWSALLASAWLLGGVSRAWVTASIFFALSVPLLVASGWAEMLRLRPALPGHTFPDAVITADETGVITGWDGKAQEMFGWTAEQIIGRPIGILIPEQYRQAHEDGIEAVRRTGQSKLGGQPIEAVALDWHGEEFPVQVSAGVHHSQRGITFTTVVRDLRRSP